MRSKNQWMTVEYNQKMDVWSVLPWSQNTTGFGFCHDSVHYVYWYKRFCCLLRWLGHNQEFQRVGIRLQYPGIFGMILIISNVVDLCGFVKWRQQAITDRVLTRPPTKKAGVTHPHPSVVLLGWGILPMTWAKMGNYNHGIGGSCRQNIREKTQAWF